MSEEKVLSKNALIAIGVISSIAIIIGITLLALGYNESFYLNYSLIQAIFKAITFLGDPIGAIIVIAIFYIVYDKKFGKNLAFGLMMSEYINKVIKGIFQDPRPLTNINPEKEYGFSEPSYGFPSGHAQNAVVVWGYVGYEFKEKPKPLIVPILVSILIFLVAISRVIIGFHDLEDIVGGYAIGICLLILYIHIEPIISSKLSALNLPVKILIVVAVSISLFLVGILFFPTAGIGLVDNPPLYADEGSFALVGGATLGLGIGYLLETKYIKYNPSEINKKQKIINLIIGILFIFVAYYGLDFIISGNVFFRFVRFAIIAFTLVFIAPLVFSKLNRK